MQTRKLLVASLLFALPGLTSCGSLMVSNTASDANAVLNGNWHLVGGAASLAQLPLHPMLTLTMGAVGNQIYGSGDFFILCSNGGGGGGSIIFTGSIAADGTFTLTDGSQSSSR